MTDLTLRPISAAEFPEFYRVLVDAFHDVPHDSDRELSRGRFEPARSLAAFDGTTMVSTTSAFGRVMTVPGALLPIAAVTAVSVAATHRRLGLLTSMMRRQLTDLHEHGGEPVAALWASEAAIYQRFGYGMASREARLTARTRELRLRPGTDLGTGRIRLVGSEEARPALARVYEAQRVRSPGFLDRTDRWWDRRLYDPEHARDGGPPLRFALRANEGGEVTGYAVFRTIPRWGEHDPDGEIQIRELIGLTPAAYAALWSFLLGTDLVRTVRYDRVPVDEPLPHLVDNPRAVELSVSDQLWLRLVDVGRALAARRYTREVDVVFKVTDEFCPWNAGRWRLTGGPDTASCEPTTAPADVTLTSTELAAAYLGGTTLATLALAGRVVERRPGALAAVSAAFHTDPQPWCPEIF
ncbi:MAG: GNAT family N-acetyltransferase [Actinobacteria bacterium]|nr:GNAT family N-acetyltransferase [Actinomycetota bacterium]